MTSYTSEDNISGGFSSEDNFMYIGRTVSGSSYYKGFIGNIVITSRTQFQIQSKTTQATNAQPAPAASTVVAQSPGCPTPATVEALMKLDLASGVDVEIKI